MTTLISWEQICLLIGTFGGFEAIKYYLNYKANKRMVQAQASSAETDAAEKFSHLYEVRIAELHTSLVKANELNDNLLERIANANKATDKAIDRCHELTMKLYESEKKTNEVNDAYAREKTRTAELERLLGNERLRAAHYENWHCQVADCAKRQPPNPSLRGQIYTKPKGYTPHNPNTTEK